MFEVARSKSIALKNALKIARPVIRYDQNGGYYLAICSFQERIQKPKKN